MEGSLPPVPTWQQRIRRWARLRQAVVDPWQRLCARFQPYFSLCEWSGWGLRAGGCGTSTNTLAAVDTQGAQMRFSLGPTWTCGISTSIYPEASYLSPMSGGIAPWVLPCSPLKEHPAPVHEYALLRTWHDLV
ncbi:hypothetical protein HaLaN_20055 [Haematococcus lacustris]|uniref:Uncharacterized protein n=1 Tax=Haematococcus lacustris TaxID=44745 RepID=A0A699ZIZ4_HAELA|nr:hypothetical protein HaLaN_20055 [Haematococcus lacustris]